MTKTLTITLLSFFICYGQSIPIPQIEFSPEKYICYRSEEILNIDGKLNEESWKNALWTDDFVDIEGSSKPAPRFRTRAKMLWDDNYFYVAALMEEPDIWGTLKNRDDIIFYDNDFEVFIDPDGNTHSYFEFEMNALNTIWDLLLIQPYRDINNAAIHAYDVKGLKSGVEIYGSLNNPDDTDSSWTVEIAFPWEAFKELADIPIPPDDKNQWRINFSRVEWKTEVVNGKYQKQINSETNKPYPEDNWVWSPQGVINMHYPEMWGYVQFSDQKVSDNKNISFIEKKGEEVKWLLRQIYYLEKKYYEDMGTYTDDLKKLGITPKSIPGYKSPVIESTTNMFEASISSENDKEKIVITHNGLVTISKNK